MTNFLWSKIRRFQGGPLAPLTLSLYRTQCTQIDAPSVSFNSAWNQSHERKVGNRRWRHWTKISAKSVTKKNPCLPSTFSSKMPPCEMFVYFRNFLKKHLVTPYSSNGSGLEDKNRSFSFFSLIEKNSKHISSSIFSRLKLWQRKNRTKNWRLTKIS